MLKTGALQDARELIEFQQVIKQEGVKSYLEIGSKFGGSLAAVANVLPSGSRVVSVDLEVRSALKECIDNLRSLLFDVHMIAGDSVDPRIVEKVRALGPYDLILIDGNHTEPYVRMDWLNYGPMARIVAFHDIAYADGNRPPKPWKIEVPKVWNEIKAGHRHQEIKMCSTGQDNGIGILWHSIGDGAPV